MKVKGETSVKRLTAILKHLPVLVAMVGIAPVMAVPDSLDSAYSGIKLRNIGAAHTGGRISDFAVVPGQPHKYYIGVAAGGVWKTENAGTTFSPIFDKYGSYAVGVVELDPKNPDIIWVGTGENNAQRSVAGGDGVYKSSDGGKSFTNMGLKKSGHISQIIIDPRDSNIIYVAAQGPLWSNGGDRGLYKSIDGGKSWQRVLKIDQYTGINEVVLNKDKPDQIIASSYQRRRHTWTLINGGPGSAIHKSNDGGASWTKLSKGLPASELGRIGLAAAPSQPSTVYAIIEANDKDKGVYRSDNFGESWRKQSGVMTTSPQYYNELVVAPDNPERVYLLDTFTKVSDDGGKTFKKLAFKARHVDDHALWINPKHGNHLRIGGDGGVYESFDSGQHWNHLRNLPLTQFYRIATDNDSPFYNVYGGTQDNNTLGAAVRNTSVEGITNADWWVTLGGDGFEPAIDPSNPDIVYSQYQYGGLARIDRKTREKVYITPQPQEGENALRWNWNSPLLISPHNSSRLYYGAEKLFRSDDRGESWTAVSADLSRNLDRNKLKVMGRVWSIDAIAKNDSTSVYGSLIALDESRLQQGLIAVGSDDGLIHVSVDGGDNWRQHDKFRGVPEMSLVEDLQFSQHHKNVLYAVFDNHKQGDEKPYLLRSDNLGKSWQSIAGNLPQRGTVHSIAEDHIDPNLLFAGTEYGVFFSQNKGASWKKLKGMPTIAVRDLEIQRRENDLLMGTFGRGIYVLDDYAALRTSESKLSENQATLFPVKDTPIFIKTRRWGGYSSDKGMMGDNFFIAPNPEYGVNFRYYLRDGFKTLKQQRLAKEKKLQGQGKDTPYPSWDSLRLETQDSAAAVWLLIKDADGKIVRRLSSGNGKGLQTAAWDFRLQSIQPIQLKATPPSPWGSSPNAPLALPGRYTAQLAVRKNGELKNVGAAQSFRLTSLGESSLTAADRAELQKFQQATARLQARVLVSARLLKQQNKQLKYIFKALDASTEPLLSAASQARLVDKQLQKISLSLYGDRLKSAANEKSPWGLMRRINSIIGGHWDAQAAPLPMYRQALALAAKQQQQLSEEISRSEKSLLVLMSQLEGVNTPWLPGSTIK